MNPWPRRGRKPWPSVRNAPDPLLKFRCEGLWDATQHACLRTMGVQGGMLCKRPYHHPGGHVCNLCGARLPTPFEDGSFTLEQRAARDEARAKTRTWNAKIGARRVA